MSSAFNSCKSFYVLVASKTNISAFPSTTMHRRATVVCLSRQIKANNHRVKQDGKPLARTATQHTLTILTRSSQHAVRTGTSEPAQTKVLQIFTLVLEANFGIGELHRRGCASDLQSSRRRHCAPRASEIRIRFKGSLHAIRRTQGLCRARVT